MTDSTPPTPPNPEDRRAERRTTMVYWPVTYAFDDAAAVQISSEIHDFSPSGAFIAASEERCQEVAPGRTLTLHGELWGAPFTLPAAVRWAGFSTTHQRFGLGVVIDRDLSLQRLLDIPPPPRSGP